jgi:hypothetical protein
MQQGVWRRSFAVLNLSLIATSEWFHHFGIASVFGEIDNCPELAQNKIGRPK